MSAGALLFWVLIGAPVALTIAWWCFLLVALTIQGIGKAFKG